MGQDPPPFQHCFKFLLRPLFVGAFGLPAGLADVFRAYLGTLWDCLGLSEASLWVSWGSLGALSPEATFWGYI